jgi:hypothetical protein
VRRRLRAGRVTALRSCDRMAMFPTNEYLRRGARGFFSNNEGRD